MPMPRKLPSRTKFEKYERCRTLEPAQRINASSTNSITKLNRTSRGPGCSPACGLVPVLANAHPLVAPRAGQTVREPWRERQLSADRGSVWFL